jgi:hypothetical protein
MPVIECAKCGGLTNTAVSNWIDPEIREDRKAHECYAKVVDGIWGKGCAYDNCNPYLKYSVDGLIGTPAVKKVERPIMETDEHD